MRETKPHLNLSVKASQEEGLGAIDKVQDLSAIADKSEAIADNTHRSKVQYPPHPAKPKQYQKTITKLEKRLLKTNQILNGAKTRPSTVNLPQPRKFDGGPYKIHVDSEFESEDDESMDEDSESSSDSQNAPKKDARVTSILNRGMRSQGAGMQKDKKGNMNKRKAEKLKSNKMNWYAKQEAEIFQEDFNPKKCKTVNRKQYVNNAPRPYDDDESESDESDDQISEDDFLDQLQNGTSLGSDQSEDEVGERSKN